MGSNVKIKVVALGSGIELVITEKSESGHHYHNFLNYYNSNLLGLSQSPFLPDCYEIGSSFPMIRTISGAVDEWILIKSKKVELT